MKILIINPNSDENTEAIMEEKAKNLSLDGVEVDVVHVTRAPKPVSYTHLDVYKRQLYMVTIGVSNGTGGEMEI